MPGYLPFTVPFKDVNPFFCHSNFLTQGVEVIPRQKAVPSFANHPEIGVFNSRNPYKAGNSKVIRKAR
jgi:hypothetical protein